MFVTSSVLTEYAEPEPAEAGGEVRAGRGGADAAPRLLVRLVAHHALQTVAQGLCQNTYNRQLVINKRNANKFK